MTEGAGNILQNHAGASDADTDSAFNKRSAIEMLNNLPDHIHAATHEEMLTVRDILHCMYLANK